MIQIKNKQILENPDGSSSLPFRIRLKRLRTFPLLHFSREHLSGTGFRLEDKFWLSGFFGILDFNFPGSFGYW
ncbi:hypothetical protein RhiirA5_443327 [Rhizophagus irregularis]|uniref:Uncharacterized protein n=1 Tax=Rhizophagus irregularis TaxID=588596 RepID=A0A2N0NE03_9GLOM|nr:hypothetical protein RhiirA5_443327 [Rhizophagus irregularis]